MHLILAPHPYRGKRNEPAWVTLVAEEIARLKGLYQLKKWQKEQQQNALKIFKIR